MDQSLPSASRQVCTRSATKLIDSLIFGYLKRRQYHGTIRSLLSESTVLKDESGRFHNGSEVYIHVNDTVYDRNLEQIVESYVESGRFDLPAEWIDFGVRLRQLTNEYSTMTSMKGRMSDNQMKLYGKRARARHNHNAHLSMSLNQGMSQCIPQDYGCSYGNSDAPYVTQLNDNVMTGIQSDSTSTTAIDKSSHSGQYVYHIQVPPSSIQHNSGNAPDNTLVTRDAQSKQLLESSQQHMFSDYSTQPIVSEQVQQSDALTLDVTRNGHSISDNRQRCDQLDSIVCNSGNSFDCGHRQQDVLSTSQVSESGAHKRKANMPHRRGELIAQTLFSNTVGMDIEMAKDPLTSSTSVSLLSNIDDSTMQALDRLLNGNLCDVFPFCGADDLALSDFTPTLGHPSEGFGIDTGNTLDGILIQDPEQAFSEQVTTTNCDNRSSKQISGEIEMSKSKTLENQKICENSVSVAELSREVHSSSLGIAEHTQFHHDVVKVMPCERAVRSPNLTLSTNIKPPDSPTDVDHRLTKDFRRKMPKIDTKSVKPIGERNDIKTSVMLDSRNMPEACSRNRELRNYKDMKDRAREVTLTISHLFDDGQSSQSSRESSISRESKKEQERRRREVEMERERQREKDRLRRQRDRSRRNSPERKIIRKNDRSDDERKTKEDRDKGRKKEQRKKFDEAEKKRMDEKEKRNAEKKRKEEEIESKRRAERHKRAEAMRRKDDEYKKKKGTGRQEMEEVFKRFEDTQELEENEKHSEQEQIMPKDTEECKNKVVIDEDVDEEEQDEEELEEEMGDRKDDFQGEKRGIDNGAIVMNATFENSEENNVHKDAIRMKEKEREENHFENETLRFEHQKERDEEKRRKSEVSERKRKVEQETRQREEARKKKSRAVQINFETKRKDDFHKPSSKKSHDLEQGMMMNDVGVLDRIGRQIDIMKRKSEHEEPVFPPQRKLLPYTKIPKLDKSPPVDYQQVLFSDPIAVKRTPPTPEKKKNMGSLEISCGINTGIENLMISSSVSSARLGVLFDKSHDKHCDLKRKEQSNSCSALERSTYNNGDNISSYVANISQYPKQQQKFAPQKRAPTTSIINVYQNSSPTQSSNVQQYEPHSSKLNFKRAKLDPNKITTIMSHLHDSD